MRHQLIFLGGPTMSPLTHEEYLKEVAASRARAEKRIMEAKAIFDAEMKAKRGRPKKCPQYGDKPLPTRDPRPLIKAPAPPAGRSRLRRVGKRKVNTLAKPGDVLAKCHPQYPHYALGLCRRCYSKRKHREKMATRMTATAQPQ